MTSITQKQTGKHVKAAMNYASHAWKVVPLKPKSKAAVMDYKKATTAPEQIREWWKDDNLGIGMPCEPNGVFALDIDPRNGGRESLQELTDAYGELPETPRQDTGGGGEHYIFQHPGFEMVGEIAPGVDIKSKGYIVVEPSIHPETGREYVWDLEYGLFDVKPAKAPDWLLKLAKKKAVTKKADKKTNANWVGPAIIGDNRNIALTSNAGRFRRWGMEYEEIAAALLAINEKRCHPPLGADEVKKVAWSVCSLYQPQDNFLRVVEKRGIIERPEDEKIAPPVAPTVEEFPADVLPGPAARLVREAVKADSIPGALIGPHVLVAMATAIGITRSIRGHGDWYTLPVLYHVAIAPPGSNKSGGWGRAVSPITEAQERYEARFIDEMEEYEREKAAYDALSKKEKSETEPPRPPEKVDLYTTNATGEAVIKILQRNPRGVGIFVDELAGFLKGMNQYKDKGKGNEKEMYLSLWSGNPAKLDRADATRSAYVPRPFACVTGTIQPKVLQDLNLAGQDDGFIDRFLMSYPEKQKPQPPSWERVSDFAKEDYAQMIHTLYNLSPDIDGTAIRPRKLEWTEEALKTVKAWHEVHAEERGTPDFPDELSGVWQKLDLQFYRLALTVHMGRYVIGETTNEHVDDTSATAAWALVDYFKSHLKKAYGVLEQTDEQAEAIRHVEYIRKKGGEITLRDFQRNKNIKKSEAKTIFTDLADYGYGEIQLKPRKRGTGDPVEWFVLYQSEAGDR